MKLLFTTLLLSAISCAGQLTSLTFSWDASTNATGYRLYEIQGTNRVLLGTTSNLTLVVTNWNVGVAHTVAVTATNMVTESELSQLLIVPPAPPSPKNLKPVPLSIVMPVPGVIELSHDLVDWIERVRLFTDTNPASVRLTWIQYPQEPITFMRVQKAVQLPLPPTIRLER